MSWITKIAVLMFCAYIAKSLHFFYELFVYQQCSPADDPTYCLRPLLPADAAGRWPNVQLRLYTNNHAKPVWSNMKEIYRHRLDINEPFTHTFELKIPPSVRKNGSMHAYLFLTDAAFNGDDMSQAPWIARDSFALTRYEIPQATTFNLVSNTTTDVKTAQSDRPVTHLHTIVPLNVLTEHLILNKSTIPNELLDYVLYMRGGDTHNAYLPLFAIDEFRVRLKELVEVKLDTKALNLTVSYEPISFGRLRLSATLSSSFAQLYELGFTPKDVDELKSLFTRSHFYLLAMTIVIATIHILFDFLAFKNDVAFWRKRKTMVGISTRTLMWRCFSHTVVFFYLLDEQTSYLVLVPAGISVLVEMWKLQRALKISLHFNDGWRPRLQYGELSVQEQQSGAFDVEGMRILIYLLIPLCIGGAVYNLIYVPQKSWHSWLIRCLANCVYAFGFLFMLPQLFINYKLKSVAHLPWRAFTYKAFNTFIDDIFAFIITMPTAHRLACFRDDIVFFIYLYQRWIYNVDKSRINEFGETFDEELVPLAEETKAKNKKTQ